MHGERNHSRSNGVCNKHLIDAFIVKAANSPSRQDAWLPWLHYRIHAAPIHAELRRQACLETGSTGGLVDVRVSNGLLGSRPKKSGEPHLAYACQARLNAYRWKMTPAHITIRQRKSFVTEPSKNDCRTMQEKHMNTNASTSARANKNTCSYTLIITHHNTSMSCRTMMHGHRGVRQNRLHAHAISKAPARAMGHRM